MGVGGKGINGLPKDVVVDTIEVGAGGAATETAKVGGTLDVNTTEQATTGTTEEILATYTLPANTLDTDGKMIRISVWGSVADNANVKKALIYLGTEQISSRSSSTANVSWMIFTDIIRVGASSQVHHDHSMFGNAAFNTNSTASRDETTALDITIRGLTVTQAGDLTFKGWSIELLN